MSKTIAKIHVLKAQLGIDDETYRAMLKAQTGSESSKDLSEQQRLRIISHLQARLENKESFAGADNKTLLGKIADLTRGKHKNYVETIADKMHKKKLIQCSAPELLQIIDALQ